LTAATRELAPSACQGKLGARAMVRLEPRTVTMYRVEWEYDGHRVDHGGEEDGYCVTSEPLRRVRVKFFRNRGAAYNWMALRLIFAKRNKLATRIGDNGYPEGCRLCETMSGPTRAEQEDGYTPICRYHDHGGEYFEALRSRLARWLRWRDQRREGA
jgi:hypothetical protein